MSEGKELAQVRPAAGGILGLTTDVDKADVVAIAAVKYEEQLEKARAAITRQLEDLNRQIKEGEEAIQKDSALAAKGYDAAAEKELARALKEAGFGTFEVQVALAEVAEAKQQLELSVSLHLKSNRYSSPLTRDVQIPFGTQSRQTLKAVKAARASVAALQGRLAEVHRKLSNIPQVERKARARLAETALSRSEEGLALLDQINTVGKDSLPQFMLESK
jgi:hypothetical protein